MILATFSCSNGEIKDDQEALTTTNEIDTDSLKLFNIIAEKDSLLFQIGFNQIDTSILALLVSDDFEFYHDEHGITETKPAFLKSVSTISGLPFKTWRILNRESIQVFPMYRNNSQDLYGAIQTGTHEFYQQHEGENAKKTSIARFTHLWVIENNNWKLKRVFSYNHQLPK